MAREIDGLPWPAKLPLGCRRRYPVTVDGRDGLTPATAFLAESRHIGDDVADLDIQLTLIDDTTDIVLAEEGIGASALPDSFRAETTLNIGGNNWWVVEAEPTTREEYEESRRLVLRLRRIESVESREVRFSLPTLCDLLPPTEGPPIEGTELLLHEDDWRQIEFVAEVQSQWVDQELAIVANLLQHGRVGAGFTDLYPRQGSDQPMVDAHLHLDDLRRAFPKARESRVAFETSSQSVDGSFALFLDAGWVLYGLADAASRIHVLAVFSLVTGGAPLSPAVDDLLALEDLAAAAQLRLVHWCSARSLVSGEGPLLDLLQPEI